MFKLIKLSPMLHMLKWLSLVRREKGEKQKMQAMNWIFNFLPQNFGVSSWEFWIMLEFFCDFRKFNFNTSKIIKIPYVNNLKSSYVTFKTTKKVTYEISTSEPFFRTLLNLSINISIRVLQKLDCYIGGKNAWSKLKVWGRKNHLHNKTQCRVRNYENCCKL